MAWPVFSRNISCHMLASRILFRRTRAVPGCRFLSGLPTNTELPPQVCLYSIPPDGGQPKSLFGHTRTVYCLAQSATHFFSGSYDKTILGWSKDSFNPAKPLVDHSWAIFCMAVWESKTQFYVDEEGIRHSALLFSGSGDHSIKIWSLPSCKLLKTIPLKRDVRCLHVHNDSLFSAEYSSEEILIWDIPRLQFKAKIPQVYGTILAIDSDSTNLYLGSWNYTIEVYDLQTLQFKQRLKKHKGLIERLCIHNNLLFSGSKDSTINVWDTEALTHTATITGHQRGITGLAIFNEELWSCSSDSTIRSWSLRNFDNIRMTQFNKEIQTLKTVQTPSNGNHLIAGFEVLPTT